MITWVKKPTSFHKACICHYFCPIRAWWRGSCTLCLILRGCGALAVREADALSKRLLGWMSNHILFLLQFSCCSLKEIFSSAFWHIVCSDCEVPFSAEALRDISPFCRRRWLCRTDSPFREFSLYVSYSCLAVAPLGILLPELSKPSSILACAVPGSVRGTAVGNKCLFSI